MSFFRIVLGFLRQRLFASLLTAASVAVGVALVAAILALRLESERAFSQKDTGFEVIVGAKGSPLQLVLNTMYHLGSPNGNIPLAVYEQLRADKRVSAMLPMVFGDNVGGYKVIGTAPEFFTTFRYRKNIGIQMAEGKPFEKNYQVVIGTEVAQRLALRVGDSVTIRHGLAESAEGAHEHGKMPIVGILAPTQTAIDKGVYSTMETVWDIHYHEYEEAQEEAEAAAAKARGEAVPEHKHEHHDHDGEHKHEHHDHEGEHDHEHHDHAIPPEWTTVTAMAVKLKSPIFFESFIRSVNEGTAAQAAMPIREIMALFEIVGNVNGVLLGISYLVIVIGVFSILVSLYTTLNERRREIAILRALGARRQTIFLLILSESVMIALVGGVVGIGLSQLGLYLAQDRLKASIGGNLTFAPFYTFDAWLLAGVIGLSALVALLPAIKAYRTDVARNLAPLS
ncbi:MAG: ABC transporter permease [Candidatus Kapabacteria bacterium]|jgi:putative ABC transport system permease protein|nr:ABC transporter permease [Candidatus Kapabacteria bacterium]